MEIKAGDTIVYDDPESNDNIQLIASVEGINIDTEAEPEEKVSLLLSNHRELCLSWLEGSNYKIIS